MVRIAVTVQNQELSLTFNFRETQLSGSCKLFNFKQKINEMKFQSFANRIVNLGNVYVRERFQVLTTVRGPVFTFADFAAQNKLVGSNLFILLGRKIRNELKLKKKTCCQRLRAFVPATLFFSTNSESFWLFFPLNRSLLRNVCCLLLKIYVFGIVFFVCRNFYSNRSVPDSMRINSITK